MEDLNRKYAIRRFQQGSVLKLKTPVLFTSSFTVDTILGQLNWTNNNGSDAQYEVYSSTNGGADVLLATTAAGATSYQDTTCKQNASVVYKIRAKKGSKYSDMAVAVALKTPLCWKTDQSVLTAVVINTLNIAAGKSVTVNWGDGTSQAYSGNNSNITKNYGATGQYNIWISGDTDSITSFNHSSQTRSYGIITNWILPSNIAVFVISTTSLTINVTNLILPNSLQVFSISTTNASGSFAGVTLSSNILTFNASFTSISGSLPNITAHATNDVNYQIRACNISDSNVTVFRKAMTVFNVGNQNVPFPTANIDKLLKALADWYQVNAPTANCTFTLSGANMGIPTGGASNVDLTRLVGYYTAAGKTATVLIRTS